MITPTPDEVRYAAVGANDLDTYFGSTLWAREIDRERLTLGSCEDCVLGQLFEDADWADAYNRGLEELELSTGHDEALHGFDAARYSLGTTYPGLRAAWLSEINRRRQENER